MNKENRFKHESYGMLSFSRVTGQSGALFGTDLESQSFIMMELHEGELERNLSHDFYFANGVPKVRVKMSANQFAELITSLNYGSGVPCTITAFDGVKVEQIDSKETKKDATERQFDEEMNQRHNDIMSRILAINDVLDTKKAISKADREEISKTLNQISRVFNDSIPFYTNQFKEAMSKIVVEAKTEIESSIQSKITNAGLDKLGIKNGEVRFID